MILHRFAYLISVILVNFCCPGCYAFELQTNHSGHADPREVQCPEAEDIAPCICTLGTDGYGNATMDMDCTNIADAQQLYHVFHTDLPSTTFHSLQLGATHLTYLSDDVFGDATFYDVFAEDGSLTSIGPKTFIKSVSRLAAFILTNNQLTEFPFETIKEYSHLEALYLKDNPIQNCPSPIQSETLDDLLMSNTFCHDIATMDLPDVQRISFEGTAIHSIAKDAFVGLSTVHEINFHNTGLSHLESQQFAVTSPQLNNILLYDNFIETVEPDTFKGIQSGRITLSNNKLTLLPEATWRPVLDAGVDLIVNDNDLTCGCDIAWLVLEPAYHPQVASALCHNGESLINLDSFFFENEC